MARKERLIADVVDYWDNQWVHKGSSKEPRKRTLIKQHKFKKARGQMRKMITTVKNPKVLEAGCGDGTWLVWLKKAFPSVRIYGTDLSPNALRLSKARGVSVTECDIRHSPFPDEEFDLIISWGVVEHLDETEIAIHEHVRMLKVGGMFMLEAPNRMRSHFVEYRIGNVLFHRRTQYRMMVEHRKFYTFRQLKKMAQSYPYRTKVLLYGNGPVLIFSGIMPPVESIIPSLIRDRFGGNAGILVERVS